MAVENICDKESCLMCPLSRRVIVEHVVEMDDGSVIVRVGETKIICMKKPITADESDKKTPEN